MEKKKKKIQPNFQNYSDVTQLYISISISYFLTFQAKYLKMIRKENVNPKVASKRNKKDCMQ